MDRDELVFALREAGEQLEYDGKAVEALRDALKSLAGFVEPYVRLSSGGDKGLTHDVVDALDKAKRVLERYET